MRSKAECEDMIDRCLETENARGRQDFFEHFSKNPFKILKSMDAYIGKSRQITCLYRRRLETRIYRIFSHDEVLGITGYPIFIADGAPRTFIKYIDPDFSISLYS